MLSLKNIYRISGLVLTIIINHSCTEKPSPSPPVVTTTEASFVSITTATLNGTINANNQNTTVKFEYGTTISYGQNIDYGYNHTLSGSENISVSEHLTGLTPNTNYHYRTKAVSSGGTTYGNDVEFTTISGVDTVIIFNSNLQYGSISDIDDNTYKTIQIGTQTWMAENLKTTKYNDGTVIPLVTDDTLWAALNTPGYCWYDDYGTTYRTTYGALYNLFAVNTGKLCPSGWHVPTDIEWHTMILTLDASAKLQSYVYGIPVASQGPFTESTIAGDKLKETGITHWGIPNLGATNESGFTSLPGGIRYSDGELNHLGNSANWWSGPYNWIRFLSNETSKIYRHERYSAKYGLSVRCIKDDYTR